MGENAFMVPGGQAVLSRGVVNSNNDLITTRYNQGMQKSASDCTCQTLKQKTTQGLQFVRAN